MRIPPVDATGMQHFFLQEVQLGEEMLLEGGLELFGLPICRCRGVCLFRARRRGHRPPGDGHTHVQQARPGDERVPTDAGRGALRTAGEGCAQGQEGRDGAVGW